MIDVEEFIGALQRLETEAERRETDMEIAWNAVKNEIVRLRRWAEEQEHSPPLTIEPRPVAELMAENTARGFVRWMSSPPAQAFNDLLEPGGEDDHA